MIEKITDAEVKSLWIQRLPDAPNRGGRYGTRGMNAAELKAAYDALSLRIVSHYNALVDYLNAGGLAGQLPGAREGTNLEEFMEEIRSGSFSTYLTVDGSRSLSALAAAYDAHTHDGVYAPAEEVEKLSSAVERLESSSGGNIIGITVNGTDLPAEDGKVALPIVTDTSESMPTGDSYLGLCKILPFSMLYASGGAIDVKEATPSVIAQRNSPAFDVVLTAPLVNDIVKAALTDENRISGLTNAEKENARSVIGAAKASKLDILWKLNEGILYDFYTDSAEAYEKAVTSGAKYGAIEKIGGKTVSWNQLHRYSDFSDDTKFSCVYGTLSIENGEATYTVTTPRTNNANRIEGHGNTFSLLAGRFYLASILVKADASNASANGNVNIVFYSSKAAKGSVVISESDNILSSEYKRYSCIVRIDADGNDYNPRIGLFSTSGGAEGDTYSVKQFTVTDLTQMFGAGNEPSTVEDVDSKWAEQYAVSHPEYTACVLMSASVNSVSYKDANEESQITYPIPASVLALTGYGWSVENLCNTIERTETGWQYVQRVGLPSTENGYTVLDTPIVTDITERMRDFPEYFTVESGGTITFVNENGRPVPNTVEYIRSLAEVEA